MKFTEIHDDGEFYQAVLDYMLNAYRWRAYVDSKWDDEPTPDEVIKVLEERIDWVKEYKRTVDKYLRKRTGRTWARVIDGSRVDPPPDHR